MNPSPNPSTSHPGSYPLPQDYQNTTATATAAAALSQGHTPTPNGNGRKRKASSTPGSRGVANLTPEQLAKKRANDREAQRAIRERTKSTIDSLANRIKELESQQPFQELQKALQERDRALQECEELKRRLATVASVVGGNDAQQKDQQQQAQQQPNLHGTFEAFEQFIDPTWLTESDAELAALTAQQSPLPSLNSPHPLPPQYAPPTSAGAPYEQQHIHPDLRFPLTASNPSPVNYSAAAMPTYQIDGNMARRWSPSHGNVQSAQYSPTNGVAYEQRHPSPAQMQSQSNGERLDLAYVLEPTQQSAKRSPSAPLPPPSSFVSPPASEQLLYARLPNNCQPSSPLDSLLLDFLANRRQQLASGVPMSEVAGPEYPSFGALQDPHAAYSKTCHPVSALLVDILSKFPDISGLPENVAVLYIMFLILRWEICPCETCYERMPDWVKPTKEQLETPHPAWHDHVPW